jgi:thiol-disulfide isomerase/thioredoxin
MRRVAIIVSCALAFLTACSAGVTPTALPTPTSASRQAQIAQLTQVALNLAATAESRGATATAGAVPTTAATRTPTVARPTSTAAAAKPTGVAAQPTAKTKPNVAANLADFRIATYQGDTSLGGHEVMLSDAFSYGLPVVLNFWAPLCPPCRQEMAGFQHISEEYVGRVFFIGVDLSPYWQGFGGADDAAQLIKDAGVYYPVAYAVDSPLKAYGIKSIPTTVFFTPDGKIAHTQTGDLSESDLRTDVKALLALSAMPPAQGGAPSGGKTPWPVVPALNALPPRAEGRS